MKTLLTMKKGYQENSSNISKEYIGKIQLEPESTTNDKTK